MLWYRYHDYILLILESKVHFMNLLNKKTALKRRLTMLPAKKTTILTLIRLMEILTVKH